MSLVSRAAEVARRIRRIKMRGLLNDLKNREEEEGRLRTLEEMLQNDIIGINREQIAGVVTEAQDKWKEDGKQGNAPFSDDLTIERLHDVFIRLGGRKGTPRAGRSRRKSKRGSKRRRKSKRGRGKRRRKSKRGRR